LNVTPQSRERHSHKSEEAPTFDVAWPQTLILKIIVTIRAMQRYAMIDPTEEEFAMRPKHISGRTYSSETEEQRLTEIANLSAMLLPHAQSAFKAAVKRQTHREGASTLAEEVSTTLSDLLSELQDRHTLDEQSQRLCKELTQQLSNDDELLGPNDQEWIASRSQELARAFIGFWLNLDDNAPTRTATCRAFLNALHDKNIQTEEKESFQTIYSRFFLEPDDAATLLQYLNEPAHSRTSHGGPKGDARRARIHT
jgi:hypothetical protein